MKKVSIGRPCKTETDTDPNAMILNALLSLTKKVDSIHSQLNVKDKDYLTYNEACQYMGCTRTTLWKWCNEKKINRVKLENGKIYFTTTELKRLLDNGSKL